MPKVIRAFSLLCLFSALFLCLLVGCNREQAGQTDAPIPLTDTCGEERLYRTLYGGTLTPIDLGEDSHVARLASTVYHTPDGIYLTHSVGGRQAVTLLAPDGSVQNTWTAPAVGFAVKRALRLPDGTWVITRNNAADDAPMVYRIDADGALLVKTVIPGQTAYAISFCGYDDRYILCTAGNVLYLFDYDLTAVHRESIPSATSLSAMFDNDGNLILSAVRPLQGGSSMTDYYRLDTGTFVCERDDSLQPPEPYASDAMIAAGDVYYHTVLQGLFAVRDNTVEHLIEWEDLSLSGQDVSLCAVLEDETFVVRVTDSLIGKTEYALLRRQERMDTGKFTVKLGIADTPETEALTRMLYSAVNAFNRQSDTYHVSVTHYSNYSSDLVPDGNRQRYELDMLGDAAPDITVSFEEQREWIGNFAQKGAYLDLAPYIGNALLPCVTSACSDDGKLFSVPLLMTLYPLATGTETMQSLTPEQFYALGEDCGVGERLYSSHDTERLFDAVLYSFIDRDAAACAFDSAEFARFVRFWEDADAILRFEDGYFCEERGYIMGDRFIEQLRGGTVRFAEVPLDSIETFAILKLIYGDDFSLIGYPSASCEARMWLESDMDISVHAKSPVLRGAVTFLEFLLSDDVQTSDPLCALSFPVTASAMETVLCDIHHFFYDTMIPVDETGKINVGWFAGLSASEIPAGMTAGEMAMPGTVLVTLTEDDIDTLRTLFYETPMQSRADSVLSSIMEEELSAYRAGAYTLEQIQKNLQSRVSIYLQEQS